MSTFLLLVFFGLIALLILRQVMLAQEQIVMSDYIYNKLLSAEGPVSVFEFWETVAEDNFFRASKPWHYHDFIQNEIKSGRISVVEKKLLSIRGGDLNGPLWTELIILPAA